MNFSMHVNSIKKKRTYKLEGFSPCPVRLWKFIKHGLGIVQYGPQSCKLVEDMMLRLYLHISRGSELGWGPGPRILQG